MGVGTGGIETFSLNTGNTAAGVLYSGADGGPGDLYAMISLAGSDVDVAEMSCYCTQSGANDVAMGIYDAAGVKLAETALATVFVGLVTLPLIVPASLVGGNYYYLALWSNASGARFLRTQNGWTGLGPTVSFEVPNSGGLPADISSQFGNKKLDAFYVSGVSL